LKPFIAAMAMLLTPLELWLRVKLVGVAASVKIGCATMVSAMVALAVRLPEVPVMVSVADPVVAFAAALKVTVPGLKVAITPEGKPVAANVIAPLNPFCGTTVMVLAPLAPGRTLKLVGDAVSAKLGGAATVKLTVAVLCKVPDVPVIVTVEFPSVAEALAVRVSVPGLAVVAVLKDAVTPVGSPDAARVTVPLKAFCGVTEMVLAPVDP
jgi:hypothetical protein